MTADTRMGHTKKASGLSLIVARFKKAPKPSVAVEDKAAARTPFRFTAAMVARAARKPGARAAEPFALPSIPPGMLPKNTGGMAMDQFGGVLEWAGGAVVNAPFADTFIGYPELAVMAQRPEYRQISETIAMEMTREWIEIKVVGDDKSKADKVKRLDDAMDRLKVRDVFRKAAELDGFFGRSHIYVDTGATDDPDELKMPLVATAAKIGKGSLKALRAIEPVWCYPTTYDSIDPLKPAWYNPTQWFVMGKQVHSSRLLRFVGREVPDLLKPAYQFGGLSLTQLARPYVEIWLQTRQSVADLIRTFSIIWYAADLTNIQNGGEDEFFQKIEFFTNARNNRGLMVVNKESEQVGNLAVPLSGLSELQAQAQEHMCAVSRTPAVKLLGIQPAGLNASSEGEIRTWEDYVAAFQERLFGDHLRTVMNLVQLSEFGEIDPAITYAFRPVRQVAPVELSNLEKTKADTHGVYLEQGVVSPKEVREALAADEDSPYHGLDVDDVPLPGFGESEGGDPMSPDPTHEGKPGSAANLEGRRAA